MINCPICNKGMSEGFIYSSKDDIKWTPKDKNVGVIINKPKEYEVLLAKLKFFKGCRILVYRCNTCKIQLIIEKECNSN